MTTRLKGMYILGDERGNVDLFEDGKRTPSKQEFHTELTSQCLQEDLKTCLTKLVHHLFGSGKWFALQIQNIQMKTPNFFK